MANVVEDSLVRTLMQVNFVKTKEAFIKAQGKGYDRAKLSAEWDAYEKEQRGKMMGVDHNRDMEWVGASSAFIV